MSVTEAPTQSRAVLRQVEAGQMTVCDGCGDRLKFEAKVPTAQRKKVICNVYEGGRWSRVEQYHVPCYDEAGKPYGEPQVDKKFVANGRPKS